MQNIGFRRPGSAVIPVLAVVLLGLLGAVGCQPTGPQVVTLKATEFAFTPNNVNLKVGQVVQLSIPNDGAVDHDLKSEIPIANLTYQQADNTLDEQRENIANGALDIDFGVGHKAQVSFVPKQAGTYTFYCDIVGHREAGMQGTFVVAN
jgi:uncharacterized cupredoxin-like copper-binding protein